MKALPFFMRLSLTGAAASGLALALLISSPAFAANTGELLQKGLYAEEVDGNIESAIKIYDQVIKDTSAPPNHVAQALYRQGMCYLKLKDENSARVALERLNTEYAGQTDLVMKARPVLEELTDLDPASLMPPGTLVYIEFGAPGKQIDMMLNLLKGTPFENPLAAVAGNGSRQKSTGDIVGALLNPSMMAEFKKIRSSAIGITGVSKNHPEMISVLYPGKSDALRGLILAALGMLGTPAQPIEGMQSLQFPEDMAVAYDDKIIISARPASQLQWCVKQYKGRIAEPTLAANKSFAKVKKTQREQNALTLWANVDEAYAQVLKMFPAGQVPMELVKANAAADFANMDELIVTESFETNGLTLKADFQLKEGHHCLAYQLIHTPNISKSALEAVPADAIALASFSLSQADSPQASLLRAQLQNATGLDLGRELFANIQQVTLFLMPAGADEGPKDFLRKELGLVITSRNPAQTRQLLATLVGTATGTQPDPNADRFKVGNDGKDELYCHVGQAGSATVLSLDRGVVDAALAALKNHKSVATAGSLSGAVNQLAPTASKAILINAGGMLHLLGPQLIRGKFSDEQTVQARANIDQLARAMAATTLSLCMDEEPNNFSVTAALSGIPQLTGMVGPATQLARLHGEAQAARNARQMRLSAPAIVNQASRPPVIDGNVDDAWSAARSYKLGNMIYGKPASAADLSGSYRALWDENNLYLLVDVNDDVLKHDTTADKWYESDGVEVYIDADDAKAGAYGQNDYQYAFSWDKTSPAMQETKHTRTAGVQYALVTTDTGYRVEIKFPWTTLGVKASAGAKVGLDVHVNDSDGGGKRDHKITWHDQQDNSWENPQAFGDAELAGLVGWWKFDEGQGTTAADSSGGHHHGTLVGHAKWGKGRNGGAIDLDGAGSFVRIADKAAFDFGGEATIAAWVNIRSVPVQYMSLIAKGDTAWRLSTHQQERRFHFGVNGYEKFGDDMCVNASQLVNAGEWHHLAGVYDGSRISLYVDGKLDESHAWNGVIGHNDFEVLIGDNAESGNRCFDGLIDDVRVYNYALPESGIKALAAGQ